MKTILIKILITTLATIFWCSPSILIGTEAVAREPSTVKITTESSTKSATKKKKKFKKFKCYVKKTKVKVHKRANKNSKVIKTFYKGKKLKVYAIKGKWYKVGKNKWIHKNHLSKKNPMGKYQGVQLKYLDVYNVSNNRLTRRKGEVYYNGHRETFYSQRVLPGHGLKIPGRHVANDGTVRDKDGYICISCNPRYKSYGSKLMTSLGPGKVYDCGVPSGTIDIYVNW